VDLSCLRRFFQEADFSLPPAGRKTLHFLPFFTNWLLRTFQLIYLIEWEKTVLGFVGLYDIKPGKSLKLSIAIFSSGNRRKGYGTEALELLLPYLQKKGLAEEVSAEVSGENRQSLSFFTKAGFEITERSDDRITLSRKLSSSVII
jgi:RimJ/RimL family protein N-acetyltransferase